MSNIGLKTDSSFADPTLLGKNLLINGDFHIWQRGITGGAGVNDLYLADHWYQYLSAGTPTFDRVADGPLGFRYCWRLTDTTAAGAAYGRLRYRFESRETFQLSGKRFTIQWWAKSTQNSSSGGGGSPTIRYYSAGEDTFTGGSTSVSTTWVKTQAISSSWQQYALTGVFPTFTASDSLEILLDTGSSFFSANGDEWRIAGMQLHLGSGIQPFYARSFAQELALCQRYYEKNYSYGVVPGTASLSDNSWMSIAANTSQISGAKYCVPKRAIPTVTLYAYTGASATLTFTDNHGSVGAGTSMSNNHTEGGWFTTGPGGTSLTKGNGYFFHWTAQAELL